MLTEKRFRNENRCNIFNYIVEHPGKHFSDIMRQLNLTKRGLGYHLERLVGEGLIVSKSRGIFKFYYLPGAEEIRQPLTPMQQEIMEIIKTEPATTEEVAEVLDKSNKAVEYHIRNLFKMDAIVLKDNGYWHYRE